MYNLYNLSIVLMGFSMYLFLYLSFLFASFLIFTFHPHFPSVDFPFHHFLIYFILFYFFAFFVYFCINFGITNTFLLHFTLLLPTSHCLDNLETSSQTYFCYKFTCSLPPSCGSYWCQTFL